MADDNVIQLKEVLSCVRSSQEQVMKEIVELNHTKVEIAHSIDRLGDRVVAAVEDISRHRTKIEDLAARMNVVETTQKISQASNDRLWVLAGKSLLAIIPLMGVIIAAISLIN